MDLVNKQLMRFVEGNRLTALVVCSGSFPFGSEDPAYTVLAHISNGHAAR